MYCYVWIYDMVVVLCFFFFKQKTAYDMRISDWSSDVCSSDLFDAIAQATGITRATIYRRWPTKAHLLSCIANEDEGTGVHFIDVSDRERSEEHTSELQSLMRISYAVFCLKKKTKQHNQTKHNTSTHSQPPLTTNKTQNR